MLRERMWINRRARAGCDSTFSKHSEEWQCVNELWITGFRQVMTS